MTFVWLFILCQSFISYAGESGGDLNFSKNSSGQVTCGLCKKELECVSGWSIEQTFCTHYLDKHPKERVCREGQAESASVKKAKEVLNLVLSLHYHKQPHFLGAALFKYR